MAIYQGTSAKEYPIYGGSRLGVYFKTGNTAVYQLTDHLGNVRALIQEDGELAGATDYYPFGMVMPGRSLQNGYRYAYQGQEKDPETGKEAFQLRLWDSRIGRWLTTDPYGQYSSPYLGMGNNPVNGTDRDGGFWQELWNFVGGRGWNSNAALEFQANGGALGDWTGDPFNGYRSAGYTDENGEFVGTVFNAVKDFNFKSEDVGNFRVNIGLQAGADILGIGVGANLFSTTLVEWDTNRGWYKIWENIEGGENEKWPHERRYQMAHFEGIIGVVPVGDIPIPVTAEGGMDITTIGGRLNSVTAYGEVKATSLLQIGVSKEILNDNAIRMYSQHGMDFSGSAIIGVQFTPGTRKNSFDLPKF